MKNSAYDYECAVRYRPAAAPARVGVRSIVALLAVLVAVSGCSRFDFLYAYVGDAIEEQAATYLDLDEAGEDLVANQTAAFVRWHRAAMLPRYAQFLDAQIAVVEQGGYDANAVSATLLELRRLLDETVAGAAPYVAAVLVRHTAPDKLRFLHARMAERQSELLDELKVPYADRLEERREEVTDNFERLIDKLTTGQVGVVNAYAESSLQYSEPWLANRADRQRAFLAFLAKEPNQAQIAAFIHKVLLRSHEVADPDYEPVSEARWKVYEDLLIGVLTNLTKEQAVYFVETLRDYANDMRDFST